ncbi:hypothetical protein WJX81_004417 [Elliptochloris bilobata]|uniref:Dynein regulatory complex subunit 7 n=1 Tax=Elliptochloris bilobata TaxID=381761 RepID=A0AAW1SHW9_9CHLO
MSGLTAKEEAALDYADAFERHFRDRHPHRRPLYLAPLNEAGVCSTLRPTRLGHPELFGLEGICRFVADFVTFEPLADPVQPPAHLASPASVLAWQRGDAFDLATVLVSLLLGAGFDAYVVMGYAPLAVTLNDQREVGEAVMVEPATGRQHTLAAAPYDGVEALWNAHNFWACLQMPQPHSDARARPGDLAFDLYDSAAWEALWEEAVRRR